MFKRGTRKQEKKKMRKHTHIHIHTREIIFIHGVVIILYTYDVVAHLIDI